MDEPLLRLLILLAVALVVALAGWWARRPRLARGVKLSVTELEPGVYLFTSNTCDSCEPARKVVAARYPTYREFRWEEGTAEFSKNRIGRVPSLVIVDGSGTATRWEGVPRSQDLPEVGP